MVDSWWLQSMQWPGLQPLRTILASGWQPTTVPVLASICPNTHVMLFHKAEACPATYVYLIEKIGEACPDHAFVVRYRWLSAIMGLIANVMTHLCYVKMPLLSDIFGWAWSWGWSPMSGHACVTSRCLSCQISLVDRWGRSPMSGHAFVLSQCLCCQISLVERWGWSPMSQHA